MRKMTTWLAAAGLALTTGAAAAQSCGGNYTVQPGDSLSLIADKLYKDVGKWSAIYQGNVSTIGDRADRITVGMKLRMTCIDGLPTGLSGGVDVAKVSAPVAPLVVPLGNASVRSKINLLTADDYAPFTDRELPQGGMFTDVVEKTMQAVNPDEGFAIHWVNDWSSHHEPLLSNALLDLGFPWFKPDCEAQPETYRCVNLVFSEPVFELLTLLFVSSDRPFSFTRDQDMYGKTICRPAGYSTFALDQDGRNWLADGHVTMSMPQQIDDCFRQLEAGEVDAVMLNEFTGRTKIKELGMDGKVQVAGGLPIAIDGLHVIAHKSHPQAAQMMEMINGGLTEIKANGTYQQTIDEHMARIWAEF